MNTMTMTLNEFTDIIERFGVEPDNWPMSQRAACLTFLTENSEAKELVQSERLMANMLDSIAVPEFPGLEARVLNQALPPQHLNITEKILAWLLPNNGLGGQLWRPAMAASLPLVFGFLVGNFFSFGVSVENAGFEYWDDELYMLSLNDYTEELN